METDDGRPLRLAAGRVGVANKNASNNCVWKSFC